MQRTPHGTARRSLVPLALLWVACGGETTGEEAEVGAGGRTSAGTGGGGAPFADSGPPRIVGGRGGVSSGATGAGGSNLAQPNDRPDTLEEVLAICADICVCPDPVVSNNCTTVCDSSANALWDCPTGVDFLLCWRSAVQDTGPCSEARFNLVVPSCQSLIDQVPERCAAAMTGPGSP